MATMKANGELAITLKYEFTGHEYRIMSNGVVLRRIGSGRFQRVNNTKRDARWKDKTLLEVADWFSNQRNAIAGRLAVIRHLPESTLERLPRPVDRTRPWAPRARL